MVAIVASLVDHVPPAVAFVNVFVSFTQMELPEGAKVEVPTVLKVW